MLATFAHKERLQSVISKTQRFQAQVGQITHATFMPLFPLFSIYYFISSFRYHTLTFLRVLQPPGGSIAFVAPFKHSLP
jgi:hypothetical protein